MQSRTIEKFADFFAHRADLRESIDDINDLIFLINECTSEQRTYVFKALAADNKLIEMLIIKERLERIVKACPDYAVDIIKILTMRCQIAFLTNTIHILNYANDFPQYASVFFAIRSQNTNHITDLSNKYLRNIHPDIAPFIARKLLLDSLAPYNCLPKVIEPLIQAGLHCGFYAIYHAAMCLALSHPELFRAKIPFPRKCDAPNLKTSLRSQSKAFLKNKVGIFNCEEMSKVIELTGCTGQIIKIKSYKEFCDQVSLAITNGKPVIVPYCMGDNDGVSSNPLRAHWGMIFASERGEELNDYIHVITDGEYKTYYTPKFYKFYANIHENLPTTKLYKEEHKEWQKVKNSEALPANCKITEIARTHLGLFKERIIVVNPPVKKRFKSKA